MENAATTFTESKTRLGMNQSFINLPLLLFQARFLKVFFAQGDFSIS